MSFWISVYRLEDEPTTARMLRGRSYAASWGALHAHIQRENNKLYEAPLGPDGIVYEFWSSIARQLGLTMLTRMYKSGLRLKHPLRLAQLEKEMARLEEYWNTHELENYDPEIIGRQELRQHLKERMSYLREAVDVARWYRAVLTVS
jgi:hypothetical protein